jgi:hypothetical protein
MDNQVRNVYHHLYSARVILLAIVARLEIEVGASSATGGSLVSYKAVADLIMLTIDELNELVGPADFDTTPLPF